MSGFTIPSEVREIVDLLGRLGFRVFLIGARAMHFYGIPRETGDWDLTIDKPYTIEVRDKITNALRDMGCAVQWRKWGLYVDYHGVHIDINYSPLILDDEFIVRCRSIDGLLIPSIEDLIVLKVMSGERKDINDVKALLRLPGIDKGYMIRRARMAGIDKELRRLMRRVGVDD